MRRKLAAFLAVLLFWTLLFGAIGRAGGAGVQAEETVTLKILHTNDIHASIDHFGKLAAYVEKQRQTADYSLYLDAGDISSGNPVVDLKNGAPIIALMNAVGLDAMAVGNHEFDYGQTYFAENRKNSQFPWLAANMKVVDPDIPIEPTDPYKIFDFGDLEVGVFSVTQAPPATAPDGIAGLEFTDEIETAEQYAWLADETDVLIALTHQGYGLDKELAREVEFFDLIIGGHSHTTISEPQVVNGTPIVQAGSNLENIGNVTITLDPETEEIISIEGFLKPVAQLTEVDPEVAAMVDQFYADLEEELNKVVGVTETGLTREGRYSKDVALGNFWTDAMRYTVGADIALTNNGGIRASIDEGEITAKEIYEVEPFGNQMIVLRMTGEALYEVIRYSYTREGRNQIDLQTSGLQYTIITDRLGNFLDARLRVAGEEVEPDDTYLVVVPDYIGTGGSGYQFHGEVLQAQAGLITNAMFQYARILMEQKGVINYGTEGRIQVVVNEEAEIPGEVIGYTENGLDSEGKYETSVSLGNLYTDALRWKTGADIALLNNSSVTGAIPAGPIKDTQIKALDRYRNTVVVVRTTGAEIKEMILRRSNVYHDVDLQVSGLHYTLVKGPEGDFVDVRLELADGSPFDLDALYTVAYNNYMHGHSGYHLEGPVVSDDHGYVWQTVVDFIRAQEGPIDYKNGTRIAVVLPPAREVTIAEARALGVGERVEVTGVVTTAPGAFGAKGFYVQKGDSGLYVYTHKDFSLQVGDVVQVTGKTADYHGQFQLENIEQVTVIGHSSLPEALHLSPEKVGEANEGERVLLQNVVIRDLRKVNEYGTFEFVAAQNGETVVVRVDNRTGLSYEDFAFQNGDVVDIWGISSEYDGTVEVKPASPEAIFVALPDKDRTVVSDDGKIQMKELRRLPAGGTFVVRSAEESVRVRLNPAELRLLKEKKARLYVIADDGQARLLLQSSVFRGRKKAAIVLKKTDSDAGPAYEVQLTQHQTALAPFSAPVGLLLEKSINVVQQLGKTEKTLKSAARNGLVYAPLVQNGTYR